MRYQDVVISTRPLVYLPLGDQRNSNGNYRSLGILNTQGFDDVGSPPSQRGTLGVSMGSSTHFPSPGANADRVRVAHDASMNVSTFSVAAWFRRASTGGGEVIASRAGSPGDHFWQWNFSGAGNELNMREPTPSNVVSTLTITDTTRVHHAVCVVEGTSVKHYLDGAAAGSGTLGTSVATSGTRAFVAGGLATNSTIHWTGELSHVAYWTRALSFAEVSRLYTAGRTGETF